MKISRVLAAAGLLSALFLQGCVLTSGQILAHFELPNPFTIDASDNMERVAVDLSEVDEYADHKDKLKDVTDLAILGTFTNVQGPAGTVTVYITPGTTNYADAAEVIANATRLWGPASIGAADTPAGTVTLGWDESAAMFDPAGKQILIDEGKGDGQFTLYTVGTPGGAYDIQVTDGFLVLVLDAGL